jgi:hypothetical protein
MRAHPPAAYHDRKPNLLDRLARRPRLLTAGMTIVSAPRYFTGSRPPPPPIAADPLLVLDVIGEATALLVGLDCKST